MKKLILSIAILILLAACASVDRPKERPMIYEDNLAGNHTELALCVIKKLQAESRWSVRMLQFRNRVYQDIEASEIIAYDMRLMPGIYARSLPTNPDAVMEYIYPSLETVNSYNEGDDAYSKPAYRFSMLLKEIDTTSIVASIRGDKYLGEIAWKCLEACAQPI
jgi:hypothetical protein